MADATGTAVVARMISVEPAQVVDLPAGQPEGRVPQPLQFGRLAEVGV